MKYFCAWLATCVGVRLTTKLREMERQSPLPNLASPRRNRRCSSSVQGMPLRRSWSEVFAAGALVLFLVLAFALVVFTVPFAVAEPDGRAETAPTAPTAPASDTGCSSCS